jgi:predicted ester cyclase
VKANKDIIKYFSDELWHQKRLSVIDEVFHKDALIHSPFDVKQGCLSMYESADKWLTSFPDLEIQINDLVAEGDKVVARWQACGTHMGSFFETRPTHQEVTFSGVTTFEFKQGKVAEYWALVDMNAILAQLEEFDHVSEIVE